VRVAFIAAKKAEHRVTILCRCMQVTRSGFYAWTRRGLSARAQRDVVLRTKLRAFQAASGQVYGRPRLWQDLKEDGEAVSEKRVKRLMRDEQIQGKGRSASSRRPTAITTTRSRRMCSTAT
jgi:putative transposase